jgi:hypothetical protein
VENNIQISNKDLLVKEFNGQRVVTFKDIDRLHERVEGTSKRNFSDNKKHFVKNVDYYELSKNDVGTDFVLTYGFDKKAPRGILITESGYLMLVKSLHDDLAWKVQRELVNNYFRVKSISNIESVVKDICSRVVTSLTDIVNTQQEQIGELTNDVKRIEECVGIRSKTVFDYTSYIKRKLGIKRVNDDYNNIKQCIFYEFHVKRWEQLTYNDEVMNRIDEICERVSHRKERKLF